MRRSDRTAAARLALALDMSETGLQMMKQNLRRRYPRASARRIRKLLDAWLAVRPGAELGDADGVVVAWPLEPR